MGWVQLPWAGVQDVDIMKRIQQRDKLPRPSSECAEEVYGVMLECWRIDPQTRISADAIMSRLSAYAQANYGLELGRLQWPAEGAAGNSSAGSDGRTVAMSNMTLDLDAPEHTSRFEALEIDKSRIKVGRALGEGQFGSVAAAVMHVSAGEAEKAVAVKVLKEQVGGDMQAKFVLEARILAALSHPHIVRVEAVCFRQSPNMIVVEYMAGGDLQGYLQAHQQTLETQPLELLGALVQIASAMSMLEKYRVVHRDLAARYDNLYIVSISVPMQLPVCAGMCLCLSAGCRV
jgi:hypothetical protein